MIKRSLFLWLFLLTTAWLSAQNCGLEDTLWITPNSSQVFTFEMFDAVNDNLGDPNQGICGVELNFNHQFVEDLELWLVSPENDTVQLIGDNTDDQLAFTFFANWNITFVPCSEVAMPDSGYVAQWNNDQPNNFESGYFYTGSYYPYSGCLEDFDSGLVNGTWSIVVNNNPSSYAGGIVDIRLILCDPLGLNCCFADAGSLANDPDILTCEGNDTLDLTPTPFYQFNTRPDTAEYGYTYAIGQDGVLIGYDSLTDLTTYTAGNYQVCGFSYKKVDFDSLPTPDGVLTLDSLRDNLNSDLPAFCGNISDTCINVTIVAPPPPTELSFSICEGDTLFVADTLYTMTGNFTRILENYAGCDSVVQIDLTVNEELAVSLDSTICQGDSVEVGNAVYFNEGMYIDTLQSLAGCDSIVTLNLEVLAPVDSTLAPTICLGDTVLVGNMPFFATGEYEVPLVSSQGCDSTVFLNLTVLDVEAMIAPPDTITCYNNGVTLDGSASTPAGSITYSWTNLAGTVLGNAPTYFLSSGDTLVLTVEQQSGGTVCMSSDTVIVIENTTAPIADAGMSDTLNCAISSLTIGSSNTSQGTNFTYAWTTDVGNFVSDTFDLMPLVNAPGIYTLMVTDTVNGCNQTATVNIIQDTDIPQADAGTDLLLTCTTPLLQLDGTASSQGPLFAYNWTALNGATIQDDNTLTPTITEPDSFRLIVTNTQNFCADSAFVAVVRNDTLPQVVIAEPGRLNCGITSLQLDATTSDNGPAYDFVWSTMDGGNIVAGQNTLMPTINATGSYQLVITNTGSGCQDSALVVVQDTITAVVVNPGPDATLTCAMDTVLLDGTASSIGTDHSYCWSTEDGHFAADSLSIQTMVDAPGTYQLIVKDTFTLCADTASVEVIIDTIPPVANAGAGFSVNCEVTQDTLFGNGGIPEAGMAYEWSGPCLESNPDSIWMIASCPGTYYFTVTDLETGCTATDSVLVDENRSFPQADAGPERILTCTDTTVILDGSTSMATGMILYEWMGPGVLSGANSVNPVVNQSGIYTLVVTDAASQCKDTATVNVGLNTTQPVADGGDPVTINCTNPIVEVGGPNTSVGPEFTYEWITNEGSIEGATDEPFTTVDTSGVYVLFVTDTLNGCRDTAFATVTGNLELPFVNAGPNFELDCGTDTIMLNGSASAMNDNFIYQWSGDCLIEPTDTTVVLANCPGTYVLTTTNTENGCINQDTAVVTLNPQAPVAVLADTAYLSCQTGTITLDGTSSSPGVYQWLFDGNPTSFNGLMPTVDTAGTYTLVVSTLDFSCIDSAVIEVILDCDPTVVIAEPDTITCAREIVTLDASASTGGQDLRFQWETAMPGCILGPADTPTINVNCAGTYTVIVSNDVIQLSDTLTVEVPIDTIRPVADAGLPDTINCLQPEAVLDGSASSSGPGIISFWTDSAGDTVGFNLVEIVTEPGGYFLEVMDTTTGCGSVDLVQISENTIIPNVNFGNFVFPCDRDTFGLESFVTPASPNYSYQWSGPGIVTNADSSVVQVDTLGTYFLTVTNTVSGCTETDSVTVVDQTCAPCLDLLPPDTLTCAVTTVTLEASFCLNCVDCTVEWTREDGSPLPGGDSLVVSVSEPGIYRVTATDTLGFSTAMELEVIEDIQLPDADAGPDRQLTCDSLSITIGGAGTSSGGAFVYQWIPEPGGTPSPGNQPFTVVDTEGTYILTVTNIQTGCVAMDTVLIELDTLAPVADAGPDRGLTCTSQIVTLDGGSSSTNGPFFYQWETDSGFDIAGANSLNPLVGLAGNYWLTVRDTTTGCEAVDSVSVELSDDIPEIPPIAGATLSCQDTSVLLEAMIADTSGFSFAWCQLDDVGMPIPGSCRDSLSISATEAGTYEFSLTNEITGCSNNQQVEVTANINSPEANAGVDDILNCGDESLELAGSAGPETANLSFEWIALGGSEIVNSNTLSPTITSADTFILLVTNLDNLCVAIDSVVIALDDNAPTAYAGQDTFLNCTQSTVALAGEGTTASGMINYLWTAQEGGNIQSSSTIPNPVVNQPGMYILQVTDPANDCSVTDTVLVAENRDAPEIVADFPLGQTLTCLQDTVAIDAGGSISNTAAPLSYAWTVPNVGNIIGDPTSEVIELDAIGLYRLIITDSLNGCRDTMSFQIGANRQRPMVALANPLPLTCNRETVTLNATGSSNGANFSNAWTGPDGLPLADTTLTPGVTEPGLYTLLITNQVNGCTRSDSLMVDHDTIPPVLLIEEPEVLDCIVREAILDATASSQGSGFSYEWTASPGTILSGQNDDLAIAGGPGNYLLTITNEDNGCTSSSSVEVMESASPIESVFYTVDLPGCNGEYNGQVMIDSVTGGVGPYFFAFDSEFFSDRTVYRNLAPGIYELQIEDANGCTYTEEVDVTLGAELTVDLGADIEVELGDTTRLEAVVSVVDYDSLVWGPVEAFADPHEPVQFVSPLETTVYDVLVVDQNGCIARDKIVVSVIKPRDIYIPNVFSPNGDGHNDVFMIFASDEVLNIRFFKIFDRWGNMVYGREQFQPNDPNFGWDGNFDGQPMNAAVFAFFAEVEYIDGRVEMIEGDVTLMR